MPHFKTLTFQNYPPTIWNYLKVKKWLCRSIQNKAVKGEIHNILVVDFSNLTNILGHLKGEKWTNKLLWREFDWIYDWLFLSAILLKWNSISHWRRLGNTSICFDYKGWTVCLYCLLAKFGSHMLCEHSIRMWAWR